MKAAVLHAPGETPRYGTFDDPVPRAGEVEVTVLAAGVHPLVRALADGSHYGSHSAFPQVPGVDGVGRRPDGAVVWFGGVRDPHGTMAERAAAPAPWCVPLPDGADPVTVAAAMNPGLSGWLALTERAPLEPGAGVLVLGATGTSGRLAVQAARLLGAGRVVAAGRDPRALADLPGLGADATVRLSDADGFADLRAAVTGAFEGGAPDVVLDYLWGPPAEATLDALTRRDLHLTAHRTRFVQLGESAGSPTITLRAHPLRSAALEVVGSGAGSVAMDRMAAQFPRYLDLVARGEVRVDVDAVPLADVGKTWTARRPRGRRAVLVP